MCFSPIILQRKESEEKFTRHRVPLVETHRNEYLLTPNGQGQNLTSGHVTPRSSWVKIGKVAYHSIRHDELNTIRPGALLYLISVGRYRYKTCHMFDTKNRTFQFKFRFAKIYFFEQFFGVSVARETKPIRNCYRTNDFLTFIFDAPPYPTGHW